MLTKTLTMRSPSPTSETKPAQAGFSLDGRWQDRTADLLGV